MDGGGVGDALGGGDQLQIRIGCWLVSVVTMAGVSFGVGVGVDGESRRQASFRVEWPWCVSEPPRPAETRIALVGAVTQCSAAQLEARHEFKHG